MYRYSRFSTFASRVARAIAHPGTFLVVLIAVVTWLVAGPIFHFNNWWQFIFSNAATLVTFILLFLIQHTQSREMAATQLKLNELIRASEGTHNALLDIEELTDRDYDTIKASYTLLAQQAREQLRDGKLRWATARVQMESLDSLLDPAALDPDMEAGESTQPDRGHERRSIDTPLELSFDRLARIAARALQAPIALVTLIERDQQRLVSKVGLPEPYLSRKHASLEEFLCEQVATSGKPLVIAATRQDHRAQKDAALNQIGVDAYMGIPILTKDNKAIGCFLIMDTRPRQWTQDDTATLQEIAAEAADQIDRHARLHTPSASVSPSAGDAMTSKNANGSNSSAADASKNKEQAEAAQRAAPGEAASSAPSASTPDAAPAVSMDAAPATPKIILVVDDSETNRTLLRRRLEREGYQIIASASGPEAFENLRATHIDLVLLDIMMPGMDGEQVLQQMQEDGDLRRIPVIMISALDEQDSVNRCLQLGARDYLLKPFDPVQLRERLKVHLGLPPTPTSP